jgi:hypothetical protein
MYQAKSMNGGLTMADKNCIWWAYAVKNSVMMICWAALAIYFGKWWIALFAGLFFTFLETHTEREEDNG